MMIGLHVSIEKFIMILGDLGHTFSSNVRSQSHGVTVVFSLVVSYGERSSDIHLEGIQPKFSIQSSYIMPKTKENF